MTLEGRTLKLANPLRKAVVVVAWTNVALHAAGLVAAVLFMRPGTSSLPLADRLSFLTTNRTLWSFGWGLWIPCAMTLTVFMAILSAMYPQRFLAGLALTLTAIGAAFDVTCDLVYAIVFPLAADRALSPTQNIAEFELLDRAVGIASLATANGLYSIAVVLLTFALPLPRLAKLAGYGTGAFGLLLAVAGIVSSPQLIELSTGPTMLLFCVWSVLTARWAAADI